MYCTICCGGDEVFMCDAPNCSKLVKYFVNTLHNFLVICLRIYVCHNILDTFLISYVYIYTECTCILVIILILYSVMTIYMIGACFHNTECTVVYALSDCVAERSWRGYNRPRPGNVICARLSTPNSACSARGTTGWTC